MEETYVLPLGLPFECVILPFVLPFYLLLSSCAGLFLPKFIHDQTVTQLYQQGTARHDPEQIFAFAKQDLEALSTLLGSNQFFIDSKPRHADIIIHSCLGNILKVEIEGPLKEALKLHKNLVDFVERMEKLEADATTK